MFSIILQIEIVIWAFCNLSSANASNYDSSQVLSFSKTLTLPKMNDDFYLRNCKLKHCVQKMTSLLTIIFLFFPQCFLLLNPLPHMPILGSSNSAANKDRVAKIWTNGDTIICLSRKHCGKRRNCSLRAISPFPTMFSKVVCYWCVKASTYGVKCYKTITWF